MASLCISTLSAPCKANETDCASYWLQLFFTTLLGLRAFFKMLQEWCSSGKNDCNIRASSVITANLTPFIIMERKAVGCEDRWEHLETSEPLRSLLGLGTENGSARTHMCCSGSQKAPHAHSKCQRKKSKASLTACTFLFSLKNTLGFTGLVPSFGVRVWDVVIFKQSHWGLMRDKVKWNVHLPNEILMGETHHV